MPTARSLTLASTMLLWDAMHSKSRIMNIRGTQRKTTAFTLVEIMIVVAIIGLLVVLLLPSFVKARKRSQAVHILNNARLMDAAVDQWAIDYDKEDGDAINTTSAGTYMKTPWKKKDILGHAFVVNTVGTDQVDVAKTTKTALKGAGIDWSSY